MNKGFWIGSIQVWQKGQTEELSCVVWRGPLSKLSVKFASLFVVSLLSIAPIQAGEVSPVGSWQTVSGESRYEISLCGDGTSLCAKLTWLRADARTAENMQYLNRYVLNGAARAGNNLWRGALRYGGDVFGGSVKLINARKLKLQGCKAIFCQSMVFTRL